MKEVGSYLDRKIYLQSLAGADLDLGESDLTGAVVLLTCGEGQAQGDIEKLLGSIVSGNPLGLVLAGAALQGFDFLLENLSRRPSPHVMTATCEEGTAESIETLLTATWPAEARFDEWDRYVVLVSGNEEFVNSVEAELKTRVA